ncbi:MAG: hypothetical protein EWV82_20610 [Microcystis aeruginosa Ma_AC_P_19900807_S299]|uniref:Uncharacterized protein n=1 Tax=Microcystis aeruginosa Ma_SC_T_19800800_S464 TaxID=2486257 RepID=A0A552DLT7_MICAE|nr:MAG: hypothetical protein EWV82_20610 [Microcystis aeruginosa Ma_AC_P_19900807_S299]TRU23205.1 MAG: hypothetical protein EWV81_16565 [Microcystis aeruginosa Ma_SC_T_19800800_S464]
MRLFSSTALGIVGKIIKHNGDRLTLTFKKNIDPFLPKLLIQTKLDYHCNIIDLVRRIVREA